MQINKKLYTTLIITILTLSTIIAAIPLASAVASPPGLYVPATTPVTPRTSGSVGTKVMVVGVDGGAGDAAPFSTVTVYWDSLSGQVLGTVGANSVGAYAINVTIPSAFNGAHFIVVNDGAGAQGASFTVTASLTASTTPSTKDSTYNAKVLPGDALTLTGNGFSASSAITVTFTGAVTITLTSPTITTNATGYFSAVVTVPSGIAVADYGAYTVTATDASTVAASAPVLVDYYNTVTPTSGPPGITITISGRIPASTAYSLLVDTTTIVTGTSGSDGTFSNTYTIPALIASGAHSIHVRWVVGSVVNTRTTTFTVTPAPTLTLGAASGVAGAVVTIGGAGFSNNANISLYIGTTIVNSTATDDRFGPTSSTGTFSEEFTVPALAPGVYTFTVTDQYGASTGTVYTFTVSPTPTTTIALRGTSYYPGDTISFNIFTTDGFTAGPTVTIKDPAGSTWWTNTWTLTASGATWSVLYQNQLFGVDEHATLPADAPLGSWNWTITYTPVSTGIATKATGLFTVAALPTMQTVLDRLDVLNANITSIVTTAKGDIIAVINTKSGTITTSLSALEPKLQGIEDTAVIIATMLGEVQVDIAALDFGTMGADITSIKNGMATIQTSIGTVTAGVSALDAKVSSISGDVATVKTTVVTLEGKITAIEGNVATIETSVGTIQADVTDVVAKPDVDMTPVWIAVVLSLVAAIAAIFAVVTIRQKIAG